MAIVPLRPPLNSTLGERWLDPKTAALGQGRIMMTWAWIGRKNVNRARLSVGNSIEKVIQQGLYLVWRACAFEQGWGETSPIVVRWIIQHAQSDRSKAFDISIVVKVEQAYVFDYYDDRESEPMVIVIIAMWQSVFCPSGRVLYMMYEFCCYFRVLI
jgi:hypothetical protein